LEKRDVAENQRTKMLLNVSDRFALINVIGNIRSERFSLLRLISLIEQLSLTKEEATNPALELRFNENVGSFTWKENVIPDLEITCDVEIYELVLKYVSVSESKEYKELHEKLTKSNN